MRDYFSFTPEIRFFSNGSWYFVMHIKSTHQLCDPSKRFEGKNSRFISIRHTEFCPINDAWSMMKFNDSSYRYRCTKLLNQLSRSFQFSFFLDFLPFSHESSSPYFFHHFCLQFFLFTINSNRILFATKLYLWARIFKRNSLLPTENRRSAIFPLQM